MKNNINSGVTSVMVYKNYSPKMKFYKSGKRKGAWIECKYNCVCTIHPWVCEAPSWCERYKPEQYPGQAEDLLNLTHPKKMKEDR